MSMPRCHLEEGEKEGDRKILFSGSKLLLLGPVCHLPENGDVQWRSRKIHCKTRNFVTNYKMHAKKTPKFAVVKITMKLLSIYNWFQNGTTWKNSNALILQWEVCKTMRATYSQEKCGCICAISLKCFRTILRGKPKIERLFWFHQKNEKCCKKIGLDFLQKPQPKPSILCWSESVRGFFCSNRNPLYSTLPSQLSRLLFERISGENVFEVWGK